MNYSSSTVKRRRCLFARRFLMSIPASFGAALYSVLDKGLSNSGDAVLAAVIGCLNEFREDPLDSYAIAEHAFEEKVCFLLEGLTQALGEFGKHIPILVHLWEISQE